MGHILNKKPAIQAPKYFKMFKVSGDGHATVLDLVRLALILTATVRIMDGN